MADETLLQRDIREAFEREEQRLLESGTLPDRLQKVQKSLAKLREGLCAIEISVSPNR